MYRIIFLVVLLLGFAFATYEWAYSLVTEPEQPVVYWLFGMTGVFAGQAAIIMTETLFGKRRLD